MLRERIGFDAGPTPLEDALAWAAHHDFHYAREMLAALAVAPPGAPA